MRNVFLSAGAALIFLAPPAFPQQVITDASLGGRVTDASGAVVPGAHVIARQTDTNVVSETTTDVQGRFRFPHLRVGPYQVLVRLQGFTEASRSLTLTIGAAFDLPVSLSVAGLDTSVTVVAGTPVLEAARSQIASTVSQAEIRNLPLNGRNFLDLALLVPGVSPTNVNSTQLFAETSAVPGSGISVASQRNFSNNFIVDGLSANDDAAGLSGLPYAVDAVDQFQVVTSGGQAELGRALGGYISVITRSGTNTAHGDLYGYFRDRRLNAANALLARKLPMAQKQYGGSVGGPILRNRTFYFGNVEERRLTQTGLVTIADDSVAVINEHLAAVRYPGAFVATGIYPNPVHSATALAKMDHQASGKDQLSARYSAYHVTSSNARGAGGLLAPTAGAGLDNTDQSAGFTNIATLSDRTVNETRAQLAYGDLQAPPSDAVGPAVSIIGVASFGTLAGAPTRRSNRMFQLVDNLSRQTGAHALRVGVDFLSNDDTIIFPRSVRGAYTFSSLPNFLTGTYTNSGFTQTFGSTMVSQTNPNLGVYGQDEWKTRRDLTVNAGVRYDLQFLQTISTDANNISPRLGVAWSPFGSQRTVVRGSAGLFFDRVPLRAVANALLSAGNTTDLSQLRQISVSLSPGQDGAPAFPKVLNAPVPSVTLVNFTTIDRHLQSAYSRQGSVEMERQLWDGATIGVAYQYVGGRNLLIQINQNVPRCVAAGSNNGCRPNPAYANNNQYSSAASSTYHGLHLSFIQRPIRWGNYRVSYTYSKSMNNVGEAFFNSPIDPSDLSKDWGRSDDDQRHRLVIDGAINTSVEPGRTPWAQITHGFQISSMVQFHSALPFNITSGVNTIQGTAGRPIVDGVFIARNAGVGSRFFSMSLRVSRAFKAGPRARIEAAVEAFNVTNHRNNLTRNSNFGSGAYPSDPLASFGQITAVGDPRSVQLVARVRF